MVNRREFIKVGACAALGAVGCVKVPQRLAPRVGAEYPGWSAGELDIHFINTGVGEQTFFIFPDGTTMLLDCGDGFSRKCVDVIVPRRPSSERLGGEWVSRYVQRLVTGRAIDYFLLSHWHGDHCGSLSMRSKTLPDGRKVCGVPLFAEDFDIRRYFDHQWPDAVVNPYTDKGCIKMMHEWIGHMRKRCGMEPGRLEVGAENQIAMLHGGAGRYSFSVRNVCANGVYCDADGNIVDFKPEYAKLYPKIKGGVDENVLSAGIRLAYGPFSAFFGGDILTPDYERRVGNAVGRVDVCKTNHHACAGQMSEAFCSAVKAQVYLSSVWGLGHVNEKSLGRMASKSLYDGDRIVMYGCLPQERAVEYAGRDFMSVLPPAQGHSVIKVAPGGRTFDALVLSSDDESMRVLYRRSFVSCGSAERVAG